MENIVIRGMACQFPGARNLEEYWEVIKNNKISIQPFSPSPIDSNRNHMRAGYIENVDQFDAEFFGVSKREAKLMDPQQRLLLQNTWHAIENAGIAPETLRGSKTGVFIGAMANDWFERSVDTETLNSQMITGNGLALLANRISYLFDFKGPSLTIDTACSSSLVALNQAIQSLQQNECDYAIVGGVNVIASSTLAQFYQCSGIASASGLCRPFSNHSDGIIRSEGVGVIVLCRKNIQIASYAEIVGGVINHNGLSNGITSPNRFSQQELLTETLRKTKLSSQDISYIECHGTGTELGDRIELLALDNVIKPQSLSEPCSIGAVKGLIGHTEAASGIAGIIKLALMLYYNYIPKSLYSNQPNPILEKCKNINLSDREIFLSKENIYMGISSFGLGGTNAHFILKDTDKLNFMEINNDLNHLFEFSAPNTELLIEQSYGLVEFIKIHPEYDVSTLSSLCCSVKNHQKVKIKLLASTLKELEYKLKMFIENPDSNELEYLSNRTEIKQNKEVNKSVEFPFYKFKNTCYWLDDVNHKELKDEIFFNSSDEIVIKSIANVLGLDSKQIKLESKLINDLGLDSIIVIELIEKLNKELSAENKINFMDTLYLNTVSDVIKHFQKLNLNKIEG